MQYKTCSIMLHKLVRIYNKNTHSEYTIILVKEVEKKWKSLRTQYTREKAKVKKRKSGDGADDVYKSKWLHLSQMRFIDAFVTPKTSHSNLKVSSQCMHKSA